MRKYVRPLFWLLPCLLASGVRAQLLASNEVAMVISRALTRAKHFEATGMITNGVVAVVDREGFVLGAYSLNPNPSPLDVVDAISKAGTAAFLSSTHNAFSSRTAGFIVQQHFPPTIDNTPTGPLVGVNFSSLSFSDVNHFKNIHTANPALFATGGGGVNGDPISTSPVLNPLSGLNGAPGGMPLFRGRNLVLLGGVGVAFKGMGAIPELANIQQTAGGSYDVNEDIALAAESDFPPNPNYLASHVQINGLSLAYNYSTTAVAPLNMNLAQLGVVVTNADVAGSPPYDITNSPVLHYPTTTAAGFPVEIRAPIIADPSPVNLGAARLTAAEVTSILTLAAHRASTSRAGIRLPVPEPVAVFITVVNNPGPVGGPPIILGTYRLTDATVFSWDVAIQKARTALYFSSNEHAYSVRAIGFLAEEAYPPGIARSFPGPYYGYQECFSLLQAGIRNPLNNVMLPMPSRPGGIPGVELPSVPARAVAVPELPNGITIFPGGFPLYRNGVMIGAIGVSGDGVDQDDLTAASGTANFLAPPAIRSDHIYYRGTLLPYAKFPRDPSL